MDLLTLSSFDASSLLAASWKPFLTTMPLWDYWPLLALPLCLGVAVVYKTTKCHDASEVPKESGILFLWIFLGLIAAAIVVQILTVAN
jgi:hypothetical protein